MKPQNDDHKAAERRNKPAKPRFRIEKLEERIAPAKGGYPGGKPDAPGQNCGWGGHKNRGQCQI